MFRNWGLINKQTKWWLLLLLALFVVTPFLATAQDIPATVLNDNSFLGSLYGFVVVFFGRLLGFGAGILNFSIEYFVIGAGQVFNEWGVGLAVNNIWATVRDFFNLTFIFGLVYIGFQMILDSESSSARRNLVYLIGAALLINFSLFITKFVVDIANTAAAVIARNLGDNIGTAFMNLLALSAAFDVNITAASEGSTALGLAIIFTTVVIFFIAAFVFAAGGLLLIIRFITLSFYMIFSPAMFLGWVFPNFQSFSKGYWKGFLSQAFLAPAYLFCLYFTASVLNNFQYVLPVNGNLAQVVNPNTDGNLAILAAFYYVFAIILLIGSLSVARKMASDGGGVVMKMGNNIISRTERGFKNYSQRAGRATGAAVGGATAGAAARASRRIVGGAAQRYSTNDDKQRALQARIQAGGVSGLIARGQRGLSDSLANASFDVRNVGGIGRKLGLGAGITGGYVAVAEAKKKKAEALAARGERHKYDESDSLVRQRMDNVADLEDELNILESQRAERDPNKIDSYTDYHREQNKLRQEAAAARRAGKNIEAENIEDRIKTAEERHEQELKTTGKIDRTQVQKDIKKKQEEIKEEKKKVEQEKNRLVLGSTYTNDVKEAEKTVNKGEEELQRYDSELQGIEENISKLRKDKSEMDAAADKSEIDQQIADVEKDKTRLLARRSRMETAVNKARERKKVADEALTGLSTKEQELAAQPSYVDSLKGGGWAWKQYQGLTKGVQDRIKVAKKAQADVTRLESELRTLQNQVVTFENNAGTPAATHIDAAAKIATENQIAETQRALREANNTLRDNKLKRDRIHALVQNWHDTGTASNAAKEIVKKRTKGDGSVKDDIIGSNK